MSFEAQDLSGLLTCKRGAEGCGRPIFDLGNSVRPNHDITNFSFLSILSRYIILTVT